VKKYRLRDGDVISLGVHEIVYTDLRIADAEADTESEAEAAEAAGDDEASAIGE
jgi:pSer/pThr/pTyr-binding forkhead associated (FHA) protein